MSFKRSRKITFENKIKLFDYFMLFYQISNMRINFYDQSDEKLGEIKFLGWNRSEDMGFDSEDFSPKQLNFLVAIVNKRNLRSFSLEFATITLSETEEKEFNSLM